MASDQEAFWAKKKAPVLNQHWRFLKLGELVRKNAQKPNVARSEVGDVTKLAVDGQPTAQLRQVSDFGFRQGSLLGENRSVHEST